jgi:TPP-dependent pyruvate/acetoin dehydrogenase alpha subunit
VEIESLHAAVRKEVDEAVEWAEASPFPDPATLLEDVYESQ